MEITKEWKDVQSVRCINTDKLKALKLAQVYDCRYVCYHFFQVYVPFHEAWINVDFKLLIKLFEIWK
jgi:hypothetical protein